MDVTLKKRWKNHPKGTVLSSVSDDVLEALVAGKYADKLPREKSVKAPAKHKMVGSPPAEKSSGSGSGKKD